MALTFSIGDYDFVNLHPVEDPRAPVPWQVQETDIVQRPGVNGTGVLLYGTKGKPVQVRSARDFDDLSTAADALFAYREYIGAGNKRLVWNGLSYRARYLTEFIVLDVQPLKCHKISLAAGGLSTSKGAWAEAIWTLIPVLATGTVRANQ